MLGLSLMVVASADRAELDRIAERAARAAIAQFSAQNVREEQVSVAIAAISADGRSYEQGGFRAEASYYPASVVKLFYLAHLHHLLAGKKLRWNDELKRATRDMIVDSSNDGTGLVLDTITGTTGGPELAKRDLAKWMDRRQAVNRWYGGLGYTGHNVCQKTWNEGPYGRERQGYGPKFELRNALTAAVSARLMADIATDRIVNPAACAEMRDLLRRPILAEDPRADFQSRAFIGKALAPGAKLWSKAGYVENERHDVALIESPSGRRVVLAVFTKQQSRTPDLIPYIARQVLASFEVPVQEKIEGTETVAQADAF
ncbi:MAG: serine hydrolase [Fimbriimonadaceae bacterium]|nr:serine hydrolase [Fimbriimonadaceae bacterium]